MFQKNHLTKPRYQMMFFCISRLFCSQFQSVLFRRLAQTVLGRRHILTVSHRAVFCRHLSAFAGNFEVRMWWKPWLTSWWTEWGASTQKVKGRGWVCVLVSSLDKITWCYFKLGMFPRVETVNMLKGPVSHSSVGVVKTGVIDSSAQLEWQKTRVR